MAAHPYEGKDNNDNNNKCSVNASQCYRVLNPLLRALYTAGFLSRGPIDISGHTVLLLCGRCLQHHRMLGGISGLQPLDASSTPQYDEQVSPDIAKCP